MISNFRDHTANERTFLAWVRTSISIMGFGMATARLSNEKVEVWSEVLMLVAGAIVILFAYLRMHRLRALIAKPELLHHGSMPKDTFLVALVISLFVLLLTFVLHVR